MNLVGASSILTKGGLVRFRRGELVLVERGFVDHNIRHVGSRKQGDTDASFVDCYFSSDEGVLPVLVGYDTYSDR